MAAIEVLRRYVRTLQPADLSLVEAWVREAHGWAYVDSLAGDVAGTIALAQAGAWPLIDAWAVDEDFWVRRSALLTLLPGIRQGWRPARFERYATPMLAEKEFFIRKAIGWVLRETSKKAPAYVAVDPGPPRSDVRRDVPGSRARAAGAEAARLQSAYKGIYHKPAKP